MAVRTCCSPALYSPTDPTRHSMLYLKSIKHQHYTMMARLNFMSQNLEKLQASMRQDPPSIYSISKMYQLSIGIGIVRASALQYLRTTARMVNQTLYLRIIESEMSEKRAKHVPIDRKSVV